MLFGNLDNFSRYIIYEDGSVWDSKLEKFLSPIINGGFLCVNMTNDCGKKSLEKIHRVVARTFLGKEDDRHYFVRHKDGDRGNNHISNLEWVESKLFGVGINNPRVVDDFYLKAATTWRSILSRCYYKKNPYYTRYGGSGVYVSEEWKDFKIFEKWYVATEKEYHESLHGKLEVDKDILIKGNKVYSEDTCLLVPRKVNQIFKKNNKGLTSKNLKKLEEIKSQIPSKIYPILLDRVCKFI